MEDKLAKRLGYPRPLEDGGFAVQAGWSGHSYRIEKGEFDRFVDEFSKINLMKLTDNLVTHLLLISLFVFPTGFDNPTFYLLIAYVLISLVEPLVRARRLRAAFPEARLVQVHGRHGVLCMGLGMSEVVLLIDGVGCLLLGWGLSDVYPDACAQGGYLYAVFGVSLLVLWAVVRGIHIHFRRKYGCRLTYDNLIRTEGPVSFREAS